MAKRTDTSKARRQLIRNLNSKVESLQGQIVDLKFKIEDAEDELIAVRHEMMKDENEVDPDTHEADGKAADEPADLPDGFMVDQDTS